MIPECIGVAAFIWMLYGWVAGIDAVTINAIVAEFVNTAEYVFTVMVLS